MKQILGIGAILAIVSLVIFSFISNRKLTPENYFNWFNSSQCTVSSWKQSDFMIMNLNYRTNEYMALAELNGETVSDMNFEAALKNYKCCEHFLLKIFASDTTSEALSFKIINEQEYYERIRFLSSDFGSKVVLVDGSDTLPCTFHHFERTYKMKPYISVNLIFEKKRQIKNKMSLIIYPTPFNNSEIKFEISGSMLSDIPKLKI